MLYNIFLSSLIITYIPVVKLEIRMMCSTAYYKKYACSACSYMVFSAHNQLVTQVGYAPLAPRIYLVFPKVINIRCYLCKNYIAVPQISY